MEKRGSYGGKWRRSNWNYTFTFGGLFIILEQDHLAIKPGRSGHWEHRLRHGISGICVLALPLMSSLTLDKLFKLSGFSVLICKMKKIIVPTNVKIE